MTNADMAFLAPELFEESLRTSWASGFSEKRARYEPQVDRVELIAVRAVEQLTPIDKTGANIEASPCWFVNQAVTVPFKLLFATSVFAMDYPC